MSGNSHINGKAQKMGRNLGEDLPGTQLQVGFLSSEDGGHHGHQCCSWTPGDIVTTDNLSTPFVFVSFPQDSERSVGTWVVWVKVLLTARTGRGGDLLASVTAGRPSPPGLHSDFRVLQHSQYLIRGDFLTVRKMVGSSWKLNHLSSFPFLQC